MIIRLIRYLRGYLDIKLEGVYSEKVLSDFAKTKVNIWRLKYHNNNIYCRVYAKDFKKIREIRRNTGVKVKIIKKNGFPFFWKRYSQRFGFIVGAVLFFVTIKFLSCFIWVINVNGNNTVKDREIINTLSKIGIYEAVKASKIDAKNDAQQLLMLRDDLAWASLNIEGSVLNVNVSEIKKTKKRDNTVPTNIIAGRDGIIRKIDAVSGDVRVRVGENVHKGDVLVSGIIESLSSTVFLRSNATVIAQIEKTYETREDYVKCIKHSTGKTKSQIVLELFGVKVPLFLPKKERNIKTSYKATQISIFENKVPIRTYKKITNYYKNKKVYSSEEEIKDLLNSRMNEYFSKKEIEGYIPISTQYYSDDDGVRLVSRYLCDEDIGVQSDIIVDQ